MRLIGQYDSPFVRRVGIALRLYGLPFVHEPWSVFGDGEKVRALNPLMRVPVLVLEDGFVLADSAAILDHLDSRSDAPLMPRAEPARSRAMKVAVLGAGLAEKAVSLFYERRLHDVTSPVWEARCALQVGSVLDALEADRSDRPGPWWFGADLGHADIMVACAWAFATEAHPGLIDPARYPALSAHAAQAEALPVFAEIRQPFAAPA